MNSQDTAIVLMSGFLLVVFVFDALKKAKDKRLKRLKNEAEKAEIRAKWEAKRRLSDCYREGE